MRRISLTTLTTPIKAGIEGNLFRYSISNEGKSYAVEADFQRDRGIDPFTVKVVYCLGIYSKCLGYGHTIKELRSLRNDVNDFLFDPHLFLYQ